MEVVPIFDDNEAPLDIAIFNQMREIPKWVFGSEIQVLKGVLVCLTVICRTLLYLPFSLFNSSKSLEHRHGFSILVSIILSTFFLHLVGCGFSWGLELMTRQTMYKLWAVYTLIWVVIKSAYSIHSFTHRMIRGAIRQSANLVLPIFYHSIGLCILFLCYSIDNGTYIGGLSGKPMLFLSACVHNQGVIAKKFLAKCLDGNPLIAEIIRRILLITACLLHLQSGSISKILLMFVMEYVGAFARYLFIALSEDGMVFYEGLKTECKRVVWEFQHNDSEFDSSLLIIFPSEVFAMILLSLIIHGPLVNSIAILFAVVLVGIFGSSLVNAITLNQKPEEAFPNKRSPSRNSLLGGQPKKTKGKEAKRPKDE